MLAIIIQTHLKEQAKASNEVQAQMETTRTELQKVLIITDAVLLIPGDRSFRLHLATVQSMRPEGKEE